MSPSTFLKIWTSCSAATWSHKSNHVSLEGTVLSSLNSTQLTWDESHAPSSSSTSSPPPLWQCCVSGEGYLNEVPSCVTNLQQGGEAAINICHQQPGHCHTHAHICEQNLPAPAHTHHNTTQHTLHGQTSRNMHAGRNKVFHIMHG